MEHRGDTCPPATSRCAAHAANATGAYLRKHADVELIAGVAQEDVALRVWVKKQGDRCWAKLDRAGVLPRRCGCYDNRIDTGLCDVTLAARCELFLVTSPCAASPARKGGICDRSADASRNRWRLLKRKGVPSQCGKAVAKPDSDAPSPVASEFDSEPAAKRQKTGQMQRTPDAILLEGEESHHC